MGLFWWSLNFIHIQNTNARAHVCVSVDQKWGRSIVYFPYIKLILFFFSNENISSIYVWVFRKHHKNKTHLRRIKQKRIVMCRRQSIQKQTKYTSKAIRKIFSAEDHPTHRARASHLKCYIEKCYTYMIYIHFMILYALILDGIWCVQAGSQQQRRNCVHMQVIILGNK